MTLLKTLTSLRIIGISLASAAALATAGCGGGGYGGSSSYGINNPNPTPSIAPGSQIVGVALTGESATADPTYGTLLGYFNSNGTIDTTSGVVALTTAMPAVFRNFDGIPHTASFLGDATGNGASFPPHFNGSGAASAANTVISSANFSSGTLNAGASSLQYNSGPPGFFMFGCAFHYDSNGMRTIVIVQ